MTEISFSYEQPVKIVFGKNKTFDLPKISEELGVKKGLLVCDKIFSINGKAKELVGKMNGLIVGIYSDITPNPTLDEINACTKMLKENSCDFVVALGGGSSMDLAKFCCSLAKTDDEASPYFYRKKSFGSEKLKLIAVPTTAGTGSEVTMVSVCNDTNTNTKAPLGHKNFFADVAIVDPVWTYSVPKPVIASTGIDALSHAIEGYWSKQHNPICDLYAIEATKLLLEYLTKAYNNPHDEIAREKVSLAANLAGLAFSMPKTAGVHACSYPLSIDFHLNHGEACGFTLDHFVRINGSKNDKRMEYFANAVGVENTEKLADIIRDMKKELNLPYTLESVGIKESDLEKLASDCEIHPLMENNPVKMDKKMLVDLFNNIK